MHTKPIVAIAYDFDETLTPGNMQEHSFLPDIGVTPQAFWEKAEQLAKEHNADSVLCYMNLMLIKANEAGIPVRRVDFNKYGKSVTLFEGVDSWFNRMNKYGEKLGFKIEHYIISSGLCEMIEGTSIASDFKRIFASSFKYNEQGVAEWPATAVNFTTKTQYLFRINKGALDIFDNKKINDFVKMEDRPIPFKRIIFIGDGETDIPCFSLVKSLGGHSIAVYNRQVRGARIKAARLIGDGRVNFVSPSVYSEKSKLEIMVKAIIDKIASESVLESLGKQE
jgi:hypothetical protein